MSKKKTHEEYVVEVAKANPNIEVIGTYTNIKTKVKFNKNLSILIPFIYHFLKIHLILH